MGLRSSWVDRLYVYIMIIKVTLFLDFPHLRVSSAYGGHDHKTPGITYFRQTVLHGEKKPLRASVTSYHKSRPVGLEGHQPPLVGNPTRNRRGSRVISAYTTTVPVVLAIEVTKQRTEKRGGFENQ